MLILEPRASDDETPESEASIGTADSSENITVQGATSDPSGGCGCVAIRVLAALSVLIRFKDQIFYIYVHTTVYRIIMATG